MCDARSQRRRLGSLRRRVDTRIGELPQFENMPHLDMTPGRSLARPVSLLERDEPLAALSRALELARRRGRLVAISGEAGIGKTSLLETFASREQPGTEFLWGGCDALKTPTPLGPLVDIAANLGETAERLGASVPRHELFAAVVGDLARRTRPAVVIVEDVHWADDATLDLLKYVGRRIDRTRALLVITWRDDEVDPYHAIHRLLGDWRRDTTLRLQLRPLSVDAVRQLAAGSRDPQALHTITGGNPFFVTELLDARDESLPVSVREAVMARRAGLDADARAVLDLVAIVPSRTEFALLDAALSPPADAVERCVTAGLLRSEPDALMFRHEVARMAVASAIPLQRTRQHHRLVLEALLAHFNRSAVLARIVHHAEACGAVEAIVEYAPAAARQAATVGAHRQAVEHYRRALEYRDRLADDVYAQLLESCAYEQHLTGDIQAAREARREALGVWTRLGVTLAIGRNLRWLSRLVWFAGDRDGAEAYADQAIEVLRTVPATGELAMAYSNRSQLGMLGRDLASSLTWGALSIELARRLGADDVLIHALNNLGTARVNAGEPDGLAQLEESLELALAGNLHEHAARAFANLVSCQVGAHNYATARLWLERGMAYTAERDLDTLRVYLQAWRARLRAETGLWPEACEDAEAVLGAPRPTIVSRIPALSAMGLVHVRRGEADARAILDEALALARPTREPQRLIPILAARAELAWLTGRFEEIAADVREGLDALDEAGSALGGRDRLTYWLWKAGQPVDFVSGEGPFALLMRGEWQGAAGYWRSKGCPYEQAEALMEGDLAATTRALEIFQTLGAVPRVGLVRQRLRGLGARGLPRGRRASTRAHPAGLTTRECEVLGMLARGLANPQIAARLFVTRKTVEHHVSSILGKLKVSSRRAAVIRARSEGWVRGGHGEQ